MSGTRVEGTDVCSLSRRFRITQRLAAMVKRTDDLVRGAFAAEGVRWPGLYIISGYRSSRRQAAINPNAPDSRHTECPATAVDLRVGNTPASTTPFEIWTVVGNIFKAIGGRWGGNFRNPDPNHFEEITLTTGAPGVTGRVPFSRTKGGEATIVSPSPQPVLKRARPVPGLAPI